MSAFDQLHPALQHHIVNSLGWSRLRPLQEATIVTGLRGEHAILLAPTAGGKTEAAIFPILSRMLSEHWHGLSVLYVCPIKALLNNLEQRLAYYAGLLGRRVALWHGDVSPSSKSRLVVDPPDILLTTPESLEVMLVSRRIDHWLFFAHLQTLMIDEVHAFAGDDRGWHLMYLLERLSRLAGRELQRLGLSATVGNPERLRDWLTHGCERPGHVLNPPAEAGIQPEVELDWVGTLKNAAIVISRLHRGEKRLIFCDSRARVEQLAVELRALGIDTYVSHSCLSLEERTAAEKAFSAGSNCVIVATSTLELGIDVGDLDRVIQIDAPATVSSFLQRIGRTGRRAGTARNCLFLITREAAFLQAAALLQLWSEGFVEPVRPPPLPLHILAQQLMGLALQESSITRADWRSWLPSLPGLDGLAEARLDAVLDHMLETGILHEDQGLISMGTAGERQFGPKNYLALFSVFLSPPLVKVFHGRQEIGEVDQRSFAVKQEGPAVIVLAGRHWQTRHIDWARRIAYVEPSEHKGRSQWLSSGQPMHFDMAQAVPRVILQPEPPARFSRRALAMLETLKLSFDWVEQGKTQLEFVDQETALWWTFAGKVVNAVIVNQLAGIADKLTADDFCISIHGFGSRASISDAIRALQALRSDAYAVPLDEDFIAALKFGTCLSQQDRDDELSARYDDRAGYRAIMQMPVVVISTE